MAGYTIQMVIGLLAFKYNKVDVFGSVESSYKMGGLCVSYSPGGSARWCIMLVLIHLTQY